MTQKTYGVGIIGAGKIFEDHARAMPQRMRLVAVADRDAMRLAHATDRFGIPIATGDPTDVIERPDVDLVAICTPPAAHEMLVTQALEAGKHVVCEKPLAHSLASAERIARVAERHPGRLSVVYQLRYVPDVQKLLWLRDHGRLGELVCGHFVRFDTPAAVATPWWGRWPTAGGGVVMTQFIHQLDLACLLFGRPAEVHAHVDTFRAPIESEDTAAATIRFRSGAIVSLAATLCAQAPHQQWHIFGTRGAVANPWAVQTDDPGRLRRDLDELDRRYPPLSKPAPRPSRHIVARAWRKGLRILQLGGHPPPPPTPLHTPYYRAIRDALDVGEPLPIGAETALASVELCTAIYVSGLTGETVQLPLDRSHPYCNGVTADDFHARPDGHERAAGTAPARPGTRGALADAPS